MPTPLTLPYPPLLLIDTDDPLTWKVLSKRVSRRVRKGVSLCVRSAKGHEMRGGFFFHFKRTDQGYVFGTFDRQFVLTLATEEECIAFINHVAGRKYDEQMWHAAQRVNFRTD